MEGSSAVAGILKVATVGVAMTFVVVDGSVGAVVVALNGAVVVAIDSITVDKEGAIGSGMGINVVSLSAERCVEGCVEVNIGNRGVETIVALNDGTMTEGIAVDGMIEDWLVP